MEFLGNPNDKFKIRAFVNASLAIRASEDSLEKLAQAKRLKEIPGVGEGIAKKIEEYIATGKITEFELLKKTIPKGFFEMMSIPSLGPKKVKVLYEKLNIKTIEDLEKAVKDGRVAALDGFGERSSQKILEGIEMRAKSKGRRLLGSVYLTVNEILDWMKKCEDVSKITPAGSFRRVEETVGDIDILATGRKSEKIIAHFLKMPFIEEVLAKGDTKASIFTKDGLQVDLRVVAPSQFGSALQYFTGSKLHNIHLRTFAKNRGFKLSEYGFFKGDKLVASKTEEDCYRALGMQYIEPELRSDTGEIEAAYKHELPDLINLSDIKGDLHTHSTWSDGANSIEEMAAAAEKRGYEYIAISDHSQSLTIANGLSIERVKAKKRDIDKLNEKFRVKILLGTEVDILADGSIDYPNDILKMFDTVVASIHSRFQQDNTERILAAMENPFVNIIGHPSGRLIGSRNPYQLDYEKLFKKAAETGTAIEINSHYQRLDLQDKYMRDAKRYGCMFSINTDSHSIHDLWMMELGVAWARRGWIEKKDVLNTFSLNALKKKIK